MSAADKEAPMGVASLARSFVQSMAPLCSGGDLGDQLASLQSCVAILDRSSETLLQQPYNSGAAFNMISVATGSLVSVVSNSTNNSSNANTFGNIQNVQQILNITTAVALHSTRAGTGGMR